MINSTPCPICTDGIGHSMDDEHAKRIKEMLEPKGISPEQMIAIRLKDISSSLERIADSLDGINRRYWNER